MWTAGNHIAIERLFEHVEQVKRDLVRTVAVNRQHAESVGDMASRAATAEWATWVNGRLVGIDARYDETDDAVVRLRRELRAATGAYAGLKRLVDDAHMRVGHVERDVNDERRQRAAIAETLTEISGRLRAVEQTAEAVRLLLPSMAVPEQPEPERPATISATLPNGRTVTLPTGPAPGSAPKQPAGELLVSTAYVQEMQRRNVAAESARELVGYLSRRYERSKPHHPGSAHGIREHLARLAELLNTATGCDDDGE
jgi:hypothetical protein